MFNVGDRVLTGFGEGMIEIVGEDSSTVRYLDGTRLKLTNWRLRLINNSPIKTVTRKEIVAGVYSRLSIKPSTFGKNEIELKLADRDGHTVASDQIYLLNAEELRQAAMVFNQIAEVLEENA